MSTTTKDAQFFSKEIARYLQDQGADGKKITSKVTSLFQKLSQRTSGKIPVIVESAVHLTQTEKRTLERIIAAKVGTNIQTDYSINKSLLLGLKIHAGDVLIDTSGETQLEHYIERLTA